MVTATEVLAIFNLEDIPFQEAIQDLPVSDVMAISEETISGENFVDFVKVMKLVIGYETRIQRSFSNALLILHEYQRKAPVSMDEKDSRRIRRHLLYANGYQFQLKRARKQLYLNPQAKDIELPDSFVEDYTGSAANSVLTGYPYVIKCFCGTCQAPEFEKAIADLNTALHKSKDRVSTCRRREFRKAVVKNQANFFNKFMDECETHPNMYALHETKIDRLVIDVYSPDLLTYDPCLKSHLNSLKIHLKQEYNVKDIPSLEFIQAISDLSEIESIDIDSLVAQFELQRSRLLKRGYLQKGQIISITDFGKCIFTYNPDKTGSPIRLRIIANVQNLVREDLFKDPIKKACYESHTWNQGSELNFIMPEDYSTYLQKEKYICSWLEFNAKDLFHDMVREYLGVDCSPVNTVVYVSQFEVCYETAFNKWNVHSIPFFGKRVKGSSKELFQYMNTLFLDYYRFVGSYANLKWEKSSGRPMFYCDVPSLSPELPVMQYKVYPKFRNMKNQIMLRHEFIPTKFAKLFYPEDSETPLSMLVLCQPDYVREVVERVFQCEMKHNGQNGQGYNARNFEVPQKAWNELFHKLMNKALLGAAAKNYEVFYESLIDSGIVPNKLRSSVKKQLVDLGVISKVKRGKYEASREFKAILDCINQ